MKQLRVAVVGAGPIGLIATQSILEMGYEVDLINPSQFNDPSPNNSHFENKSTGALAKKTKFGSAHMYQYPETLISRDANSDYPLSSAIGGLSTVWGANTWFPAPEELNLHKEFHADYLEAEREITQVLSLMGSQELGQNFNQPISGETPLSHRFREISRKSVLKSGSPYLGSSLLAVDETGCIKCGSCLTGCPQRVIFSADDNWESLLAHPKVKSITAYALKILNDKRVQCSTNGEIFVTEPYDFIFVACGAIATTALLQRSKLIPTTAFLHDTQVIYFPFFTFHKKDPGQSKFTLAQLFYRSSEIKNGVHVSIYETSSELPKRAIAQFGNLARLIPTFAWNRIVAGIGFLPPEISGRLKISTNDGLSTVVEIPSALSKREVIRWLKNEFVGFRKSGLHPLTIGMQIPNVGASYHVGALHDEEGEFLLAPNGEVKRLDGVYVIDSASLPRIPVGPITVSAMINAKRIVSKIFKGQD